MKKAFAMIMALMMVFTMATTAFAADTTTLSVNTEGHTDRSFNAYQIMTVTNDGEAFNYTVVDGYRDILVDVLSIDTTGKDTKAIDTAILEAVGALANSEAVIHFADDLYRAILSADPAITPNITGWNGSAKTVEQGYWLIADVTEGLTNETNSLVILDTAGDSDVTVNLKADVTDSDKKVDDENDSVSGEIAGKQAAAYGLGK